jgi:hypothetical protein
MIVCVMPCGDELGGVAKKGKKRKKALRVLKAVAAFVATEEFVRKTNIAAHATYSLKIHHLIKL